MILNSLSNKKIFQLLLNNTGITLTSLIIGAGINGVLILGTMQLHNHFTQVVYKNNLLVTKQQLINEIDMIPQFSGNYIQDTMESNIKVKNCIKNAGICREEPITDFILSLSNGINLINGNTGVFYSDKGVPCSSWSVNCPFKITSTITPICPTNSNTCKKADSFLFNFNIQINPNVKKHFNLKDVIDREIYIHHSAFDEDRNIMVSQQCASGEIVTSLNTDGTINCEPQPETIRQHITYVTTNHIYGGDGGDGGPDGGPGPGPGGSSSGSSSSGGSAPGACGGPPSF